MCFESTPPRRPCNVPLFGRKQICPFLPPCCRCGCPPPVPRTRSSSAATSAMSVRWKAWSTVHLRRGGGTEAELRPGRCMVWCMQRMIAVVNPDYEPRSSNKDLGVERNKDFKVAKIEAVSNCGGQARRIPAQVAATWLGGFATNRKLLSAHTKPAEQIIWPPGSRKANRVFYTDAPAPGSRHASASPLPL